MSRMTISDVDALVEQRGQSGGQESDHDSRCPRGIPHPFPFLVSADHVANVDRHRASVDLQTINFSSW